jgi:hypothetical protein
MKEMRKEGSSLWEGGEGACQCLGMSERERSTQPASNAVPWPPKGGGWGGGKGRVGKGRVGKIHDADE